MNRLKMLCFTLIAALAAVALAGVGSASATVLCKTTTTPCGSLYGKGTIFVPSLTGSNLLETLEGETLSTCLKTNIKVKIEESGSATSTVSGPVEEMVAGSCTFPTTTIKKGSVEIHHIASTDNGTVTGLFSEVTVNTLFFGSCAYGAGTGVDIGTLIGGASPVIKVNAIVKRSSGSNVVCPEEARWTGEYKVTEPTPLYVEPS